MAGRSVLLRFTGDSAGQPVISRTIRRFDVEVNITRAFISPEEEGHMTAVFSGDDEIVETALRYLGDSGVQVVVPASGLVRDEDLCTHCTACTGHCPTGALRVDRTDMSLLFSDEDCISCGVCIPSCPFGALAPAGAPPLQGGAP